MMLADFIPKLRQRGKTRGGARVHDFVVL